MVMRSSLQFRGSRPGLFYDLSAGEFCPLRISASGGLRFPPLISREKDNGLPPVTTEKTSCPPDIANYFMLSVVNHVYAAIQPFVKRTGAQSFICAPVIYKGESLGVLFVDNLGSKRPLTQSDILLRASNSLQYQEGMRSFL